MLTVGGISFSSTQKEEEEFDINGRDSNLDAGRGKVLLRDWLLLQANESRIPGLEWMQVNGKKYLKIPWVHGSKASWTADDSKVFESWAKYTGGLFLFYNLPYANILEYNLLLLCERRFVNLLLAAPEAHLLTRLLCTWHVGPRKVVIGAPPKSQQPPPPNSKPSLL